MSIAGDLMAKITSRKAVIGVMGLGYVGLPLVREFCASGFHVIGFDVDTKKVDMLNAGKTYIKHLPGQHFKKLIRLFRIALCAFRSTGSCLHQHRLKQIFKHVGGERLLLGTQQHRAAR